MGASFLGANQQEPCSTLPFPSSFLYNPKFGIADCSVRGRLGLGHRGSSDGVCVCVRACERDDWWSDL
jgi:hypothetical protein